MPIALQRSDCARDRLFDPSDRQFFRKRDGSSGRQVLPCTNIR